MLDWNQNQANRDAISRETGDAPWAKLAQEFGLDPRVLRHDEIRILELCAARIGGYTTVIERLTSHNRALSLGSAAETANGA